MVKARRLSRDIIQLETNTVSEREKGVPRRVRPSSTAVSKAAAHSAHGRRQFLLSTTAVVGAVGAGFATCPFVASWRPSARALAVGGPVTVNVTKIDPGEQITEVWRGRPVWVLHRTPEMLHRLQDPDWLQGLRDPKSEVETQQPPYAKNATRSLRPEYLVIVALCTHLGCVPSFQPEVPNRELGPSWIGGYYCPCHGSKFDFARRV